MVALKVKILPVNSGDARDVGPIPWSRKWQPTSIFVPGELHGLRSLVGCNPWGHKELDTTEHTHSLSYTVSYLNSAYFGKIALRKLELLLSIYLDF